MRSAVVREMLAKVIVVLWGCGAAWATTVVVPRCCALGEALDPDALLETTIPASAVGPACRVELAAPPWAPRVYAPARGKFLERTPAAWHVAERAVPACAELRVLPESSASYALLANNGSLWERSAARALPPDRYCGDARAALACVDADAHHAPAKCCAENRTWDGDHCVADEPRALAVLAQLAALSGALGVPSGGWPACTRGYSQAGSLEGARLAADGALQLADGRRLAGGRWCAEAVPGADAARVMTCESTTMAVAGASGRHVLYGAALAVGAGFLAATLAAGFALPAAHHALHWRCQTHYVAALMLADLLLAATHLAGNQVPTNLCKALAVCMHFLFLSAFFWLNTMCFNIWWTFRDFRPTSLERSQEALRLRVYMVYAWGGPLALAGTAALLDHLPAASTAALLRPRFAVQRCWFFGDMEILVYFFGPVGVLLLVNLVLFLSTTRQLTCGLWRRDEVKSTSERAALGRVCAKLVVVMGVTWGADVVSWGAGGPEYVWYATDVLNALQGVLIFLVVGCQRHAWSALRRAAAQCCRRGGAAPRSHPPPHSSTHLPSCGDSLTHTTPAPSTHSTAPPAPPRETVC